MSVTDTSISALKAHEDCGEAQKVREAIVSQLIAEGKKTRAELSRDCLLYTSPSPRDQRGSRMPSSA